MTTQNAVLMLVFNRPDVTQRVFQAVRAARPPRLYIAADGPRPGKQDDVSATFQVREVFNQVDWPCEVQTRYLDENLGCRNAVSSAIDWFFRNEEQGIILEDDVLPAPAFFGYCDAMLERYKYNERIFSVVGNNLVEPWYQHPENYFFSKVFFVWGWASWRRAWQHYDVNMTTWPMVKCNRVNLESMPSGKLHRMYWRLVFDLTFENKISTWDHQWTYAHWEHNALTVTPSKNLVWNIGFGKDATHTSGPDPEYIKSLRVALQFEVGHLLPEVIDNKVYYSYVAPIVFGISVLTWCRLSLRRFPIFFSLMKTARNKIRSSWGGEDVK